MTWLHRALSPIVGIGSPPPFHTQASVLCVSTPESTPKHNYHGQPYARVDLIPVPESILSQGLWIHPQKLVGFCEELHGLL
jgi:hypothetical protein